MFQKKNHVHTLAAIVGLVFLVPSLCFCASADWYALGARAASEAFGMINKSPGNGEFIVLSNAGYAEIQGQATQGCIDGLCRMTGASRGKNTLAEVQSLFSKPLWFAICHKNSGKCAYLQVDSEADSKHFEKPFSAPASELFSIMSAEKIASDYIYANPDEFADKVDNQKVFGENAFRVVTIANALMADAPIYLIRSVEFHDHYCPGVTSGILMANYVKEHFPKDGYFVQALSPWCKEDALMIMLNATPGKSGYAADYPNDDDKAEWKEGFETAATIVYGQDSASGNWEGIVLGFQWGSETGCGEYENLILDKLCSDLYYLERIDNPQPYVKILKRFELPQGETPKDWARPGVDPMERLGLGSEK